MKDQYQSGAQLTELQRGQRQGSGVSWIERFSPEDLRALEHRELRRATFHEAGHAALVRRYGGLAEPFVWPNDSGSIDEKAWRGTCQITVMPGEVNYPAGLAKLIGRMRTPKRWPLYVGLAGYVAEMIDQGFKNSEELYFEFMMAYDLGDALSPSDLRLIQSVVEIPRFHQIEITLRHLLPVWHLVEKEAEHLAGAAPYDCRPKCERKLLVNGGGLAKVVVYDLAGWLPRMDVRPMPVQEKSFFGRPGIACTARPAHLSPPRRRERGLRATQAACEIR